MQNKDLIYSGQDSLQSNFFFLIYFKNYISFAQNYDVSANMQGALSGTSASLSVGNGDIKHFCITSQSKNAKMYFWSSGPFGFKAFITKELNLMGPSL